MGHRVESQMKCRFPSLGAKACFTSVATKVVPQDQDHDQNQDQQHMKPHQGDDVDRLLKRQQSHRQRYQQRQPLRLEHVSHLRTRKSGIERNYERKG